MKETAREREKRILSYWKEKKVFEQSVENRSEKEPFVFYEGPPTANGMPHIGHVLGRVMKDFVSRYKTMTGYQVYRKAGWDTHGLPVELGVEKQLGISGKQQIEAYGVEKFIEECKKSVFHYESEWKKLTEAIGYWVDMERPYVTLDDSYIESVWNLLSDVHKKGLLYKGHRVSPYCPCCQTSLSSHEVDQGYEEVTDLSVTAKFKVKENEYILVWTTTPWTLPANVALAVNQDLDYMKVKQGNETFIVSKNRSDEVVKGEYELLSTFKGKELVGLSYEAPFQFVSLKNGQKIVHADFVSEKSGTGIVHLSPAHGEDDYKTVKESGLDFVLLVDQSGCYKEEVTPLKGKFVKDCDVSIIQMLHEKGLLYSKEKIKHKYPFCWRCKSPLLYYAMDSWFVEMTKVKKDLLENNEKVEWFPGHVKEGRFGNFLEEVVDWNISRNRYWGTPLNVWECECNKTFVPSSKEELKSRSVVPFDELELHKPYVDEVEVVCTCGKMMKRTPEVVDVWFDSGSMPYAQHHYPFEKEEMFQKQFPADLVCEGIDQTRGWFYSLLAISTIVKGTAPYKRVMALGHVLDENGKKMSKSKGNVIDPWEIIEEFGTDAFRWSLLSDSVPWNPKKFSKQMVQEAKSKVIDTLMNVHSFYELYANIDGFNPLKHKKPVTKNEMDKWILSKLQTLAKEMNASLEAYDFLKPAKQLEKFIDELSNWYVRRNRERFWKKGMSEDKLSAYFTLLEVLFTVSKLIAPYTPFLAEDMYQKLNKKKSSVHLEDYPGFTETKVDLLLEEKMEKVLQLVELSRSVRNEEKIKNKQPLSALYLIGMEDDFSELENILKEEVNVKSLLKAENEEEFTTKKLKLDFRKVGKRLGKEVPIVKEKVESLTEEEINQFLQNGTLQVGDHLLTAEDVLVEKRPKEGFAAQSNGKYTVMLNTDITKELKQEGMVREVIRFVQECRKEQNLPVEKKIELKVNGDRELLEALQTFEYLLKENLLLNTLKYEENNKQFETTIEEKELNIEMK